MAAAPHRRLSPLHKQVGAGPRHKLDLKSIRQALTLDERLSIRRAAAHLGLQASAASRRLQSFEEQIYLVLSERRKLGIKTTFAGRHLLDRARVAISELEVGVHYATILRRGEGGTLGVAFFTSLAFGPLHKLLISYRARFPLSEFSFLEGMSSDQLAALRRYSVR